MRFNSAGWVVPVGVAALAGLGALYVTRPATLHPTQGQQLVGRYQPGVHSPDPLFADEIRYRIPRDRIRAIDAPTFVPARDAAWVSDQTPVIGVAAQGEAKAYPVPVLSRVEVVNDQVAVRAIAVTW